MRPHPIWLKLPLLRWLLPFITGIFFQKFLAVTLCLLLLYTLFSLAALLFFEKLSLWLRFKFYYLGAIILQIAIVFTGMTITCLHDIKNSPYWYGNHFEKGDHLFIVIDKEPALMNHRVRVEVSVAAIEKKGKYMQATGSLYCYFPADKDSIPFKYGDRLWLIQPELQNIRAPDLPGKFDFRAYAALKNMYHQCYVRINTWHIADDKGGNRLNAALLTIRKRVIAVQNRFIGKHSSEAAVANALLIGYKNDLDRDLLEAYTASGVVHVIAISGMHLALVNLLLLKLLSWVRFSRYRYLSACINLTALWLFALLTGASPSVLRSAWMFSFVSLGSLLQRDAAAMNALAVSVFILLAADPKLIMDAGFLLSHLAVLGLLTLQKPFFHLIHFRNKWLLKTWEMLSVTLAAQVFTLPLCLYYFHQFPNYFLISNLLVIPLSTLILFGCILLIIVSGFNFPAVLLGKLLHELIAFMNSAVNLFSRLPGASSKGISIGWPQMMLLYLCILFFCFWRYGYGKKQLFAAMVCLLFYFFFFIYRDLVVGRQKKLLLFQHKAQSGLSFVEGSDLVIRMEKRVQISEKQILEPLKDFFHVKKSSILSLPTCTQMKLGKYKIYKLDSLCFPSPDRTHRGISVVWLTHNCKMKINQIKDLYHPDCIVMDGTNKMWKIEQWQKDCDSLFLRHHSVPQQGAWIQDVE